MSTVEFDKVSFSYKGTEELVLADVNLSVAAGEVVVLCGKSGCGKTTITHLINGLIPEFHAGKLWGSVSVDDVDVSMQPVAATGRMVGSVLQNPRSQFFNVDSTSELAFGCENMAWDLDRIREAVADVTAEFGIQDLVERNLFHLSGGEKQRIACACVSAYDPDVFVLDEPTSNLDLESIRRLSGIIALWKRRGKTVVVAEHRLSYLMDVADRFVFLQDGRIVWEKTPQQLQELSASELARWGLRSVRAVAFRPPCSGDAQVPEPAGSQPAGSQRAKAQSAELQATKPQPADIPSISVRDLQFHYDSSPDAGGIQVEDLTIPAASIVGIIGDNGAGKTTLARCLCGLEKKMKGTVRFSGVEMNGKQRLQESYLVMQDVNHQLFASSVADEVRLSMRFEKQGWTDEQQQEEVDKILATLNLQNCADAHPVSLSGGQKQRVAIAGALAARREILVFDEPTSGLDRDHMQQTADLLSLLAAQGVTCLVITHDPELVQTCCNWIVMMKDGAVSHAGPFDAACAQKLSDFFYPNGQ